MFFASVLVITILEAICFARMRQEHPELHKQLGEPSVFFHGPGSSSLSYFVSFKYLKDPRLDSTRTLFGALSAAYILGLLCFAYFVAVLVW